MSAAIDPSIPEAREYVRIFDTTLRDGEQAPGCSMTVPEKLAVARQLSRLGVDIIEAGFPAASPGDFDAVQHIAREAGTWSHVPVICGLARATSRDIESAGRALQPAAAFRIHTFLATSEVHLRHKLQMTHAQVRQRVRDMVRMAATFTADVQFSPEDATRSDIPFLHEVLHEAIEAGATTLNIPDTVGYTTPEEYFALIAGICADVVKGRDVIVATHCHDDLGLAVANALSGVRAGARQVECTINGIGERAGNASLEEIVMALHTRADRFAADTRIATPELGRASRLVARTTGMRVPANKAIVGANAFAHEAGIHQDGMLKHRDTYEIMRAEAVGMESGGLVLGKHSGRAALRAHLAALGHVLSEQDGDAVFARFKEVADRKKVVDDRELEAIVAGVSQRSVSSWRLELLQVSSGTHAIPTATVKLVAPAGDIRVAAAEGDGPVDAACRAIDACIGQQVGELVEYHVDAAAEGINAVGGVRVTLRCEGTRAHGYGVHTDIIVATAEAYLAAINALSRAKARRNESAGVAA